MQDPKQQQWLLEPGGLASRLRALQGRTPGVTFAELTGMRTSKISKLRRGQQLPTEDDIRTWVRAAGADSSVERELIEKLAGADEHHSSFERRLKGGQTGHQRSYNELVEQSDIIRMLERSFMPRLLQTFEYAKAVLEGSAHLHKTADDVDAAAEARLECQRFLYDGNRRFEFILDETVLTRQIAPAAAMYAQMDRLLNATRLTNVRLGILPVYGQFHDFPRNSFELYGNVGVVETYYNDDAQSDEQWQKYVEVMADAWQDVREGDGARELIRKAMAYHAEVMERPDAEEG